jgi:hypothetical protein
MNRAHWSSIAGDFGAVDRSSRSAEAESGIGGAAWRSVWDGSLNGGKTATD